MPPAAKSRTNLQAYSDLLGRLQQSGIDPEDAHARLARIAIAEVASLKDAESFNSVVTMAASRPGLSDALLAAASNASDFVSAIIVRHLCSAKIEVTGAEQWVRAWWLKANTEEKAALLKRLTVLSVHPWVETLCMEATQDADTYVAENAFTLLDYKLGGNAATAPDRLITEVALRLPAWLSLAAHEARPLLEHSRVVERIEETVPVVLALLNTLSKSTSLTYRDTSTFVSATARLGARAVKERDPRSADLLLALAGTSLTEDVRLTLLLTFTAQTRGTDLAGLLPEEKQSAFKEWLTSSIESTGLTNTVDVYPTWIRTDPSGCLAHAESILAVLFESSDNRKAQAIVAAGIAAAELWPDEFIPHLLEALRHYEDKTFLPILASAARARKGVIAPEIFQRLVSSKDAEYRVVATLSLESVASESQLPASGPQRPEVRSA